MLLIITNESDVHPNPVIDILSSEGLPFFRFNTEKILTDYDITYKKSNNETYFEIKYKQHPISISSKEITCVWERRPMEPMATFSHYEDEKIRELIFEEADGFLRFFRYSLHNVLWLGHPILERQAGSKILQKIIAKDLGFIIPDTIFSNEYSSIDHFIGKDVAIKPIYSYDVECEGGNIAFYTRKKSYDELRSVGETSFVNNINFIEEYTEKSYELRVTVIMDTCFSARIDSQRLDDEKGAIDWRQGYDHGISFTETEIPEEIKMKCFAFLKYFNLNFGCFDFIVDKSGRYVFLECNTNGQWMWLEEEAGLPISNKIAEVFAHEIKKKY